MSIKLAVRPQFRHEWTEITLEGQYEEDVVNVLVSRLAAIDYEILRQDDEGNYLSYEEYE